MKGRARREGEDDDRTRAYQSLAARPLRTHADGDARTVVGDEIEIEVTEPESRPSRPSEAPARVRRGGETIGRYILLHELGRGGMGVVWAAHDPELDRQVALKLLSRGGSPERLVREAQALARLAHPNVVAVFDAGVAEGEVWLAMELVDGVTFKTWLQGQPRPIPWRRVLDALLPAGDGIAAAHAAGLVHRDLKPENVMIGADGRARVMDFGLARADDGAPEPDAGRSAADLRASRSTSSAGAPSTTRASLLRSDVTRAGVLVGTPAYMAPEQFSGRADARADVFAFCVVLWEALFGGRPFVGDTPAATILAISIGKMEAPPRGHGVPRWLRRILVKGLALRPDDRWPSIAAVLSALRRGRARARAARIALVLGLVAATIAGALLARHLDRARSIAACEATGAAITELWPARADPVREGLAGGLGSADESFERLSPALDRWAESWRGARRDACVAAEVEGSMDLELAADAIACLEGQRLSVLTFLDALEAGDRFASGMAPVFAAGLEEGARCLDRRTLEENAQPPPEQRAAVRDLRARLDVVYSRRGLGDLERALADAEAIVGETEALGWPPLIAEAKFMAGSLHARKASYDAAEPALRAAFFTAGRCANDRVAALAAEELVLVVGHELARPKEGKEWGELAAMFLDRQGESEGPPGASLWNALATIEQDLGAPDRAVALNERALAIQTRTLGEDHVNVATTLTNLANPLNALGRHAEARTHLERALQIRERAFGPNHPAIASTLNNLALTLDRLGDPAAARPLYERTLAIYRANGDEESPRVANTLNNLVTIHLKEDQFDLAVATGERALELRERAFGPDHPAVASALNNLAIAHQGRGDLDEAEALHRRALGIRERALGPESPDVARSLTNLGEIAENRGDPAAARPLLERALQIRSAAKVAPQELAYTQFALGRVLYADGERERGWALVQAAADAWREAGDKRFDDVDQWQGETARVAPAATGKGKRSKKKKRKKKKPRAR
ncbi:MAG: serine/threonine-protein kinase [Nannocystaceae bacterium]